MNLLYAITGIYDIFLLEAETADIAAERAAKRKKKRNAALAAAGAVGLAIAVWAVKARIKRVA